MSLEMDRLAGVGYPELRETLAFMLTQQRPVTVDDVAAARGVHRNVARSRLERLVDAGLLATGYERRSGRSGPGAGRPAKTYAIEPQLRAIEFPERHYEKLAALLADSLPLRSRRERLRAVGAAFAGELVTARLRPARTLRAAAERVGAVLGGLGFQTVVGEDDGRRIVLETPTCPLRPLVRERPELAEIDRGMWTGLFARALDGVGPADIACRTHDCDGDGSCRIELDVRRAPP
jgi:predicted ArsR family transcriptional regulator